MAAGELIMRCFHARTVTHVLHLKTKSYATHKALNDFYDAIVDLTDSFAETYQGINGIIDDYPARCTVSPDAVAMLDDLASWIDNNREKCCGDHTCLQNIVDEIMTLIHTTLYKLKFLK